LLIAFEPSVLPWSVRLGSITADDAVTTISLDTDFSCSEKSAVTVAPAV